MKLSGDELLSAVEVQAKSYFDESEPCHDWSHIERVRALALNIGRREGADLLVIELAALLHDIKRGAEVLEKGAFCHAIEGALEAKQIILELTSDETLADKVADAIASHRKRKGVEPESLEAKIIYDADKLDGLGLLGWARMFAFAASAGVRHIYTGREKELAVLGLGEAYSQDDTAFLEYEKIMKHLRGNKLYTDTGRAIAEKRQANMAWFDVVFWREVRAEE